MLWRPVLYSGPATEPISRDEAKAAARIEVGFTEDDSLIDAMIAAARRTCELATGRAFITQTWDWKADAFPDCSEFELPLAPLVSVSSVTYLDADGASQTLSASTGYQVSTSGVLPRIALAPGASWPTTEADRLDAVTIRAVHGYGAASAVPAPIARAVALLFATLYDQREDFVIGNLAHEVPVASRNLLRPFCTPGVLVAA